MVIPLTLRFDLRNPDFSGTSSGDRWQAAVDMASWSEGVGGVSVSISEHHGSDDGFCPSPLVFAAALAARTTKIQIVVGALLAPFYDHVRLASDLAVLDNLSGGRLTVILGGGYVESEFSMFGVDSAQRGLLTEQAVEVLRAAWAGDDIPMEGRRGTVTPVPDRPGGPALILGGSSPAAARRAARLGLPYAPTGPESWGVYRREMVRLGHPDPGASDGSGELVAVVLAEDADAAWDELGPYFEHENRSYARWLEGAGLSGPYRAMSAAELRDCGRYRVLTPDAYAAELRSLGSRAVAQLHPMVGGIPPTWAWRSLELYERCVLSQLDD